jgi:replicative DNA helicase
MQDLASHQELPNSPEAEVTIIGSLLIDKTGDAANAASTLNPDAFYDPRHRAIFSAILSLQQAGEPIELASLAARLNHNKQLEDIGGVSYLSKIARHIDTPSTIGHYIGVLKQKHTLRQAIEQSDELKKLAYSSDDVNQVAAKVQETASLITDQTITQRGFQPIKEVAMETFQEAETRAVNKMNGVSNGLPTGFVDLDRMLGGLRKQDLIIVAARPSVGKTAFALNVGQNVAGITGETVGIISLEMSAPQLVQRMICAEVNLDASIMRNGDFQTDDDWGKLTKGISDLAERNIFIDDTPGTTVLQIAAKCRRLKREHGLGLIIIDYLQLISGSGKAGSNRQQEVSEISRTLKQLARELDIPIIALSQLSRGVEQRQDKRPMMSDLRESGAIEQDADIVSFLYRDDYYDQQTEKKNIIEIIIAKQRNGPVGTVELIFLKNFNKFVNYDRGHIEPTPHPDINNRRWAN